MRKKTAKITPKPAAKKGGRGTGAPDKSWHAKFLELLSKSCNVSLATQGAGVDRTTAYDHYNLFPDFAAAWDDAKTTAVELLEAKAWQRAETISDTLMIFLLKAHKPEMYREKIEQQLGGQLEIIVKREQRTGTTKTD